MRPLFFSVLLSSSLFLRAEGVPQKSPDESLAAMRPRPGFAVELVAAEPMVESPTAFEWDARGRLWVVEMRDDAGRIKVLTDSDGDGRFDKAEIFADALPFPTGVAPWSDGVIVAASPDILFLRDTDGDGKSDERKVWFAGLKSVPPDSRVRGFEWGLDGWLYGANGAMGSPASVGDFRFQPETLAFEIESGPSLSARRRDDWGQWFGTDGSSWVWHYYLEDRYLRRNPKLAALSARHDVPVNDERNRVFPLPPQPGRIDVSAKACGPIPYRDVLFGSEFSLSVFVCEPEHRVVHREVLVQDGATFFSRRALDEEKSEFLASSDPMFRPVFAKTGPDGALYVADQTRIWRVFPTGARLGAVANLAALDNAKLVVAMESQSGWQRDTVQRLLLERKAQDATPSLRRLLRYSKNPKARLQALATLGALDAATADDIRAVLRDQHPAVVVWALRLCETSAEQGEFFDALSDVQAIPDIQIKRQLAFSLGAFRDARARAQIEKLAVAANTMPELRIALQSSLSADDPLFEKLNTPGAIVAPAPTVPKPTAPSRAAVIAGYSGVALLNGDAVRGGAIFRKHCADCHRHKNEGKEVGPDLSTVTDKPLDWLLSAIFDPRAEVADRYRLTKIRTRDGSELSGIIVAQTPEGLTLRRPGDVDKKMLRSDIRSLTADGASAMPEGLETKLKPQDVADIVRWLMIK
jgi:putative membrane-bound dehydrogenase-like protein